MAKKKREQRKESLQGKSYDDLLEEILAPSRYESSDIDWLKSEIARIEPITADLELQVGSKLREMDQAEKETRRAFEKCLHISLISDNSEDRERLEILRQKEDDLTDEFEALRDAYEDEWYGLAMLKSRLEELIEEQEVEADGCEIKEREYNPEYDIPDEFFAIEEKEVSPTPRPWRMRKAEWLEMNEFAKKLLEGGDE